MEDHVGEKKEHSSYKGKEERFYKFSLSC